MTDDFVYQLQCPNGHWEARWDRFFAQGVRYDSYGFRCKKCGEPMTIYIEHPQAFGMALRVWCPDCSWEWRVPLVPDSTRNGSTMLTTPETFDPTREDRHWWTPPDFASIPPHRHPAKQEG